MRESSGSRKQERIGKSRLTETQIIAIPNEDRGVLMPSLVVSYSHTAEDIDRTIEAVRGALSVYRRAMDEGTEPFLVGRPSKIVYRRYN